MRDKNHNIENEILEDIRIDHISPIITPDELKEKITLSKSGKESVLRSRAEIKDIISGKNKKFIAIVGPCSVHDPKAVLEYAQKLALVSDKVKDNMVIIMRAYMEKPRSTIGWKGYFNDPHLNNACDINYGLKKGREILVSLANMDLPVAIEALDTSLIQYIADTVSWICIGARTVESQVHREMASGLSAAVGFKNSTSGNINTAIDAIEAAQNKHVFLSINANGRISRVSTLGNTFCHIVLRGGSNGPNYSQEYVAQAIKSLSDRKLKANVIIDCSHANSQKQFERQADICNSVILQRINGNENIIGIMLESFINPGRQDIPKDLSQIKYGVSVTDACMGWDQTEELLFSIHNELKK